MALEELNKKELGSIHGGFDATCTASCGSAEEENYSTVMCHGGTCSATDQVGCEGDDGFKPCPDEGIQ